MLNHAAFVNLAKKLYKQHQDWERPMPNSPFLNSIRMDMRPEFRRQKGYTLKTGKPVCTGLNVLFISSEVSSADDGQ